MLARESIRVTLARYTMAGDRLREDAFVAAFTDDAVMESEGVPTEDAFRYEGKAQIRQWIMRWRESTADTHAASFVRHHLSTSLIEFTSPNTAKGRTYWTAYTDIGPDHCGVYVDEFRNTGDDWLIAHRRVRLDWRSPASLFGGAITHTR